MLEQPVASPAGGLERQRSPPKGEVRRALAAPRPSRYDSAGVQFGCGLVRWRLPWQRLRRARWAALGCGAFWLGGPARASEPAPIQAQLEWQASTCGKAGDFTARVSRRTRHVRFSASAQQLLLQVRIEPSAGALRAEVTLQGADRPPVVRRISSPDCEDALDALALVVAIGIDQRWRELRAARPRSRRPERKPQPPPAAVDPAGAERGPAEPVAALPEVTLSAPAPVPPAPARVAPPVAPPPVPAVTTPPWSLAAGVAARLTGGVSPESLLGGELWLRAGWERGSFLSPELGLSLLREQSQNFPRPEGQADFALSAAALDLCPLRVGGPRLRLQPCAVASLGWLRATGQQTFRAHTQDSPWSSLGAGAQALALLGPVALRLAASVGHPLRRDRYAFVPGACGAVECEAAPFHRVAPAVWSIALGAGLSLP